MLSLLYSSDLTPVGNYWKIIALTRWIFVSKVMSLLFNTLSRFVIAFLTSSKHLLILSAAKVAKYFFFVLLSHYIFVFLYFYVAEATESPHFAREGFSAALPYKYPHL